MMEKNDLNWDNTFEASVALYIEASHLICCLNQFTGLYMKCSETLPHNLFTLNFLDQLQHN